MIGCNERGEEIKIIYHNEIKPNVEYRVKLIMKHDLDSIKLKKSDIRTTIYLLAIVSLTTRCKQDSIIIKHPEFIVKIQEKQKINISEYAEIIYKAAIMDTLKLTEKDSRSVYFSYSIFKNKQTKSDLENKELDFHYSSLKDNDSVIPFRVKLNTVGEYFIEGFVTDSIYLDEYYNNKKSRIITQKVRVSEKIIAIE